MSRFLEDPRISRGLAAQLQTWRARVRAGERPRGWKMAFDAPASLKRLQTTAPLTGFLMDSAEVASGTTLSLADWTKAVAEAEVALHIGGDVPSGADRNTARAAISGVGPAIELVDIKGSMDDAEVLLARNIYQRNIIVGAEDRSRAGCVLEGLTGYTLRNGVEMARATGLESKTEEWIGMVRHVADTLAAFGEKLCAGQIILAGAIVPPMPVAPGEEWSYRLEPIGALSVRFA
jgi:2-keto-4-pentenoate hydratase